MNLRRILPVVLVGLLLIASVGGVTAQDGGPGIQGGPDSQGGLAAPGRPQALLGSGISYSGRLSSGGAGVTGSCDFQFGLWTALSLGAQVGATQTVSSVAVNAGLFTTTLNGGAEFGSAPFTGEARWLAIAVKCPPDVGFTLLTPRQELMPTPYALYSSGNWGFFGNAVNASQFLGTTNDIPLTFKANNQVALRLLPSATSPNVVGGHANNSVSNGVAGAVIGGGGNTIDGGNTITASYGVIGGGVGNTTTANYATVGGGLDNSVGGFGATIAGGYNNTASDDYAVVAGGIANTANFYAATIGGGEGNIASSSFSTIAGGIGNQATFPYSAIGGGANNDASGVSAAIGGGADNEAFGSASTVAGGNNNHATGALAAVGGGAGNWASAQYATVAGGEGNFSTGTYSAIGGGFDNLAQGYASTVAGGYSNSANDIYTTVGGGRDNLASGDYATVGGGQNNSAGGNYATVPGGIDNRATGDGSVAMGSHTRAAHSGSFIFADVDSTNVISTTGLNQFVVRAAGGYFLYTNSGLSNGCLLAAGGGSWSCGSDRNNKANFAAVDGVDVLNTLMSLPIETWNYQTQDAAIRHMGPMAQDWYATFGLGEGETTITGVDADGVALAAIQGLYSVVQEKETRIAALEAQVAALQSSGAPTAPLNSTVQLALVLVAGLLAGAGIAAGAFALGRRGGR